MPPAYHPELKRRTLLLRLLPATTTRNLSFRRRMMSRVPSRLVEGVTTDDLVVDHDGLRVPVRTYRPAGSAADERLATLLWLHGGGLVMGTHRDDQQCSRLAAAHGIAVVSVDYRLTPEDPFPAATDDIVAVARWLVDDGASRGFDAARLSVGGQSAGGGLAASAAARLADGGIDVRGQLLVYPMLDDRTVVRADIGRKDHLVWNNTSNETGWTAYLGVPAGSGDVPHGAVPARRGDLSGLPPAWIGVGTRDLFHDEDVAYAQRLIDAGVECELDIVDGMIHGFDMLVPRGEATRAFHASQDAFLRSVLGLDSRP
jgi:acetyl esterase/lipase